MRFRRGGGNGARLDIFGAACAGPYHGGGGGVLRDLLLGQTPPAVFSRPAVHCGVPCCNGAVCRGYKRCKREDALARFEGFINIADAAGLGIFAVLGSKASLSVRPDFIMAVFIGTLYRRGGGIMRDTAVAVPPLFSASAYMPWRPLRAAHFLLRALQNSAAVGRYRVVAQRGYNHKGAGLRFRWDLPLYALTARTSPKAGLTPMQRRKRRAEQGSSGPADKRAGTAQRAAGIRCKKTLRSTQYFLDIVMNL